MVKQLLIKKFIYPGYCNPRRGGLGLHHIPDIPDSGIKSCAVLNDGKHTQYLSDENDDRHNSDNQSRKPVGR